MVEVLALEVEANESFVTHHHDEHELLWASAGTTEVVVGDERWVLPATQAIWIPAGVTHAVTVTRSARLHCAFEAPDRCPVAWQEPTVVVVDGLARELLSAMAGDALPPAARGRARLLLHDVLGADPVGAASLPLPVEPRARTIAEGLLAAPGDPRGLEDWSTVFGTSVRTLTRAFVEGTGLTFSEWRTHARLQASLVLLADRVPVREVAGRVGYATPGSFTTAFRRQFGRTPTDLVR